LSSRRFSCPLESVVSGRNVDCNSLHTALSNL
jgi:hypothetical protein